jgi:hypothetical protein
MTVAIDTSALSNALVSREATELFAAALLRMDAVLFVSELVIFEISSDGDTKRTLSMLVNLQYLCRKLGDSFRPAPDHVDIMTEETRHWLRGPPARSVGWKTLVETSQKELRKLTAKIPESYKWIHDKKTDLLGTDRGFHKRVEAAGLKADPGGLVELISSTGFTGESDMMVETAARLSNGLVSPAQIANDPKRYKATHAVAHLAWRLCLANCVPPGVATIQQEQVLGAWRTKAKSKGEGTWYDITIAGSAAYVDVLISDDGNQRARCEFLRARGLLSFRVTTLLGFQAGKF